MTLAVSAVVAACAGDGPVLTGVVPSAGRTGDTVALQGERLCQGPCDPRPIGYVSFGIDPQVDGAVISWNDTEIDAVVPSSLGAGDVLIVVTVDGRSSNGVSFTVQ